MKGHWLSQDQKLEILMINAEGKEKGLPVTRTCEFWEINRCRVVRWHTKMKNGHDLQNRKPGPKAPAHKLLPEERQTVLNMAIKEEYADLSHRILAVTAWDLGIFFVSFSSVYRILVSANLMSMRGHHGQHNGRSIPPVRKELTGPNQRWCWDISYLPTYEKGVRPLHNLPKIV